MSFINKSAETALRNGPSLRKESVSATTYEKDLGDTTPVEDQYGFSGKTPVGRDKLYEQITSHAHMNPEDVNIIHLIGAPKNAVHYGYITGLAKVGNKDVQFTFYYNRDGEVDEALSTFEDK